MLVFCCSRPVVGRSPVAVSTDRGGGYRSQQARSTRTGERCKRPAILGRNVCYHRGGNAPQVQAKALRRLQQAADALVQRVLGMALDGNAPDHVALQAIRDDSTVPGYPRKPKSP